MALRWCEKLILCLGCAQRSDAELPHIQMPESMGDNGVVRAFVTSLQLLPSLLGFPIALTRPDSIIAAPDPAPGPGREPRLEQLSYKGAMLDGLQASRMLHNEQAPGKHAASWQGQTQVSLPQAGMSNSVELHPAAFHLCVTSLAGLCAIAPGLCLCILDSSQTFRTLHRKRPGCGRDSTADPFIQSAVSPQGWVELSSLQAKKSCNVQRSLRTSSLACCGCAATQAPVKHPSLLLDLQQSPMAAASCGRGALMSQPDLWCFQETSRTCLTVKRRGTLGRLGRPGAMSANRQLSWTTLRQLECHFLRGRSAGSRM